MSRMRTPPSQYPMYDAALKIAIDIVSRSPDEVLSSDQLAGNLWRYLSKGLTKMKDAIANKKPMKEAVEVYVQAALQSMNSALSERSWFNQEDFGPLLAEGIKELILPDQKPIWIRGQKNFILVRDQIFTVYDKLARQNDFSYIMWNLVQRYVTDKTGQGKAWNFLNKAHQKAVINFSSMDINDSNCTLENFIESWTSDALWRIWQSGAAYVPAVMVIELCFNSIKMKLHPRRCRDSHKRPKELQDFLKDTVLQLYRESKKNITTGTDEREGDHEDMSPLRRERLEHRRHPHRERQVRERRDPSPEVFDRYKRRRMNHRDHGNSDVEEREEREERRERSRRRDAKQLPEQREEEHRIMQMYDADEFISEEQYDAAQESPFYFAEETADGVEETADRVEETADRVEETEDFLKEEEHCKLEEVQLEFEDTPEKICVSLESEACIGVNSPDLIYIREKMSGWVYCELCWNALLQQQEGEGLEFIGEYIY